LLYLLIILLRKFRTIYIMKLNTYLIIIRAGVIQGVCLAS
jgi:hypothetical protein